MKKNIPHLNSIKSALNNLEGELCIRKVSKKKKFIFFKDYMGN